MTSPATLTVFVPVRLVNPLNGAQGKWRETARRRRMHHDAVHAAIHAALGRAWKVEAPPDQPKRVTFTLHVARGFDSDAWPAICKSFRDALADPAIGLIHDDGPDSGHVFEYRQVVKKPTGVEIVVALA